MCSVLIMGGNDFITSSLAKYLIKNKYDVDIMIKKYDFLYDINAKYKEDVQILIENLNCEELKKYIVISSQYNNIKEEELKINEYIQKTSIPYIIIRPSYIYG